jgi:hypothetical protein
MLLGKPAPAQTKPETATRFSTALEAQKAFFQKALKPDLDSPSLKPEGTAKATFKASDIATAQLNPEEAKLLKPGSLLNIRV